MAKTKINSININYKIEGEGFPIIFIHGLSDNLNFWKPLTQKLKNQYQVISLDLRGHGESEKGDKKATIESYQEDLYELLKQLKIEKVAIVGLSLGGNVALEFAVKHPEMTSNLIIMSTFSEFNHHLKHTFKSFKNALEINYEEFFNTIIKYCYTEEFIKEHKEVLVEVCKNNAKVANIQGIMNGIDAGTKFFITNDLKKINVPTLVIAGEDDELTPVHTQKKLHKHIKDSKFYVLKNTKHNVLIKNNTETILKLIKDLLEG